MRKIHSCVKNSCIVLICLILHRSLKSLSPTEASLQINLGNHRLKESANVTQVPLQKSPSAYEWLPSRATEADHISERVRENSEGGKVCLLKLNLGRTFWEKICKFYFCMIKRSWDLKPFPSVDANTLDQ